MMISKKNKEEFCFEVIKFYIKNKSTVRRTAAYFNVSKTYVHNIITGKGYSCDSKFKKMAMEQIEINKADRARRGGVKRWQ